MKKIMFIFLTMSMLLTLLPVYAPMAEGRLGNGTVALYIGNENALVNGKLTEIDKDNKEVKTIVKDNRAFVPVRFVAENFGASVQWVEQEQRVIIKISDGEVVFVVNQPKMTVRGKEFALDTAPFIKEGRTYLPMRAFSEALGKEVFYSNGLVVISNQKDIFNTESETSSIAEVVDKINNLPVIGDFENLKKLANISSGTGGMVLYETMDNVRTTALAPTTKAKAVESSASSGGGSTDFSKTNVQVEGVDEADVIKTDGEYIYKVNNGEIVIVKAYPANEMKVVSRLQNAEGFNPNEIYVDAKRLVVIGESWNYKPYYSDSIQPQAKSKIAIRPGYNPNSGVTKAMIYDISDKANPVKSRELEIEGRYISSRKINASLYIVTNKNIYLYGDLKENEAVPYYRDSTSNDEAKSIPLSQIRYFPNFTNYNYMMTAGVDLDNNNEPMQVSAYMGASDTIYVSNENMYVAMQSYQKQSKVSNNSVGTTIYKFSIKGGKTTFLSKGNVAGTAINQFAMDENDGYFRIATTSNMWGENMQNNLYILDASMNEVGNIEGIAPGEKIYSVRFMGKKAYMVTFRTIDPLFVIDVSQPTAPKILGKLKIPGYSDYLHPYDENHIIGFGKDTTVTKDNRALYLGIKMAMFDVTDVENPKEMFVEKIGDRGTDSPLLHNHKALLFSKEKGLIAFPVQEMTVQGDKVDTNGFPQYGTFSFQGMYVYNLNLEKGFNLAGKVTHITKEDFLKAGDMGTEPSKFIERALYIGENLYTASQRYIKVNVIEGLKEIGLLEIRK